MIDNDGELYLSKNKIEANWANQRRQGLSGSRRVLLCAMVVHGRCANLNAMNKTPSCTVTLRYNGTLCTT